MKAIVVGLSGVKVYIVVGSVYRLLFFWLKNSSEFSGCYHESVFKPSYSSADLSVTHQNRPIMHQGAC